MFILLVLLMDWWWCNVISFSYCCYVQASSSCDGTVRVWSLNGHVLVKTLPVLPKSNDVSLSTSLCQLAWGHNGDVRT